MINTMRDSHDFIKNLVNPKFRELFKFHKSRVIDLDKETDTDSTEYSFSDNDAHQKEGVFV